ncbi:hypothetical protein GCM10009069_28380 [Algimonas arctica]|uniref:DUF4198 domain-containing protein n=1 Tax=Algimonas arctica TaxID=1479486 RepID=A0A8J3CUS1_9PROT|nr:DUF4198 domain-containing protein [Algimonas arctica]GHB04177.1 hypothetical protein GCM10009069_28380 [Algimonas arctica]
MTPIRAVTTVCLAIATLSSALVASAHDFWLAPAQSQMDVPSVVPVSVMIGHPRDRMRWPVNADRIIAFRSLGVDGVSDQQSAVAAYAQGKTLPVHLQTTGLHILTIETTRALSDLPAQQFEDYLTEEGLTLIQLDRVRRNVTDQSGTELYSRRGKTLLQVGPVTPADRDRLRRPAGLTLEIIAMDHPLEWVDGDDLQVKVLFRGAPLGGVTVGLVNTTDGTATAAHMKTMSDGTVSFAYPGPGSWMLHAVWGDRTDISDRADYSTIFSSLSFVVL